MQNPTRVVRIAFWLLLIGIGLAELAGGRRRHTELPSSKETP